jgi:hypothetical protein
MAVFIANEQKHCTIAASTADQQLPIIMAVSAVGQQNYTTPLLPPWLGQPLSSIQHIIMAVFIVTEPKNTLLLPPLLVSNYPSSWLSPLLASKNTQHHCCLPCWPAICCLH